MTVAITIKTRIREEFADVTGLVADALKKCGAKDGLAHVFVPHTTAGVTINENADPDVTTDILSHLAKMVPRSNAFRHGEGNSDAHIKASLMGSSVTVPVKDGRLLLGTWQGIYFAEFDGPRTRNLIVTIISSGKSNDSR